MSRRLRIAVLAPSHSPIVEPFSGGQAAHVWWLATLLLARGHDITLFAPPGTDARLPRVDLDLTGLRLSDDAVGDVSMPSDLAIREHHAYLSVMLQLAEVPDRFDLVHNQSLHYLPVAMARNLTIPMVTTLHTPPTPWLESAVQAGGGSRGIRFAAVSSDTARRWEPLLGPVDVIRNGVDLRQWPAGPGGEDLVWTGRLVPEKAPHLAIRAAAASGRRLVLAGPMADRDYFKDEVEPLLGERAVYAGHLEQRRLARLVGSSAAALVTPRWNEPYGLVVAEALACGTPVAGFARGGMPEIVDDSCARLVAGEDVAGLAAAIDEVVGLRREDARARAEQACSIERMVDAYEELFAEVCRPTGPTGPAADLAGVAGVADGGW